MILKYTACKTYSPQAIELNTRPYVYVVKVDNCSGLDTDLPDILDCDIGCILEESWDSQGITFYISFMHGVG